MKTIVLALFVLLVTAQAKNVKKISFYDMVLSSEFFHEDENMTEDAKNAASTKTSMRKGDLKRASEVCKQFESQCAEATKNTPKELQATADEFCYRLQRYNIQCVKQVSENESCFSKCAEKTQRKVGNGPIWVASLLKCGECSLDYKEDPVSTAELCSLVLEDCKTSGQVTKESATATALCTLLSLEEIQAKCLGEVKKNPVCFGLCLFHCHKAQVGIESWVYCISQCELCSLGATDMRVRRRNLPNP
eukprot:TRINITY_DN8502_c0_g1_i1.p1 TRINITY_DN8502_c0_g1~~TRINITY_DN8502_c0_g1_i1.p1  ORF type:complete len:248 (+),score=35.11 TRINITY_DN8502_c0_g1_i1:116-859(+)